MTTSRRLVISLLCMCSWSFASGGEVQQWSSAKSVAGDMLLVENFTDDKGARTVGRHSKASGDGSSSKGTKSSKSGKSKGSTSKGSTDAKETKSGSSSKDDSKIDKDSKSDNDESKSDIDESRSDTDSDSMDSSTASDESTKSSDESTKSSDESTKSSQGGSKSVTSEPTETGDRPESSSSSSGDSRDPSGSSESDATGDSKQDNTISEDMEDKVTKYSEDGPFTTASEDREENVTEDSEDGPFPTDSEDQPPTKKPTSPPTSKPSTEPPNAAGSTDKISTSSPSTGPTVPPTDNVFDQPTVAETPEPTYFPTDTPRCQLNALGAFGAISQDRREFEFFYQIETTPDTTEDILRNDLLPPLEREYGNRLLASLFTDCGEERRLQVGGDSASCEAIGFSGLPIDRSLAGVSCLADSRVETTNTCYAVDGGLRMYFDGECTPDTDEETMAAIRDVINSGDYDRLDPRIVNVIYLDISDINLDDANTVARSGGSSETTNLPGYAIVLLTISALCIVVGSLLFVGRRKPQDKSGFDVIPDDEGEGDF